MSLVVLEPAIALPPVGGDEPTASAGDRMVLPGKMQFYSATTQGRILKMLRSAMGPSVTAFLEDPAVTEISANSDGRVWVDRVGQGQAGFR